MDGIPEAACQVAALIETERNESQPARRLNLGRYAVQRVH